MAPRRLTAGYKLAEANAAADGSTGLLTVAVTLPGLFLPCDANRSKAVGAFGITCFQGAE